MLVPTEAPADLQGASDSNLKTPNFFLSFRKASSSVKFH